MNDVKRQPIHSDLISHVYYSQNSRGYGIILPQGRRPFHISGKTIPDVLWPTLVVEYPAMRIYAYKDQKLYYWNMPHISSTGSICMGSVFTDYRIKRPETIFKHVSQQIWGATWSYWKNEEPKDLHQFIDKLFDPLNF